MSSSGEYARFATVYENRAVITYEPIDGKRRNFRASEYHKAPTNAKYTGILSKNAAKTIDKKLHGWIYSMLTAKSNIKGRKRTGRRFPTFVTLTLPSTQKHDDRDIKRKVLEHFIKRLQYQFSVRHYFWRAEVQENGNIHFHLILDRYIDKTDLRDHWNRALTPLGYIDRFEAKHGHRNPPSTFVSELYNDSANLWYMLKYVGKEHKGRLIKGALYRFSRSLKKVKPLKIWLNGVEAQKLRQYCKGRVKRVFSQDFFSLVYFKTSESLLPFFDSLGDSFQEVAEHCFLALYPVEDDLPQLQVLTAAAPKTARNTQLNFHNHWQF